jgi:hypothetical protein
LFGAIESSVSLLGRMEHRSASATLDVPHLPPLAFHGTEFISVNVRCVYGEVLPALRTDLCDLVLSTCFITATRAVSAVSISSFTRIEYPLAPETFLCQIKIPC